MDELEFVNLPTDERWSIQDDATADWALGKIKENDSEMVRICNLCDTKIQFYRNAKEKAMEKAEQKNEFLFSRLEEYFNTVKPRETKTQYKYDLLEGSLVKGKPKVTLKPNNTELLGWCKANNHTEYIKTEERLDWSNLKKTLTADVENGIVITADGELVEGVAPEVVEGKFEIKCKEAEV